MKKRLFVLTAVLLLVCFAACSCGQLPDGGKTPMITVRLENTVGGVFETLSAAWCIDGEKIGHAAVQIASNEGFVAEGPFTFSLYEQDIPEGMDGGKPSVVFSVIEAGGEEKEIGTLVLPPDKGGRYSYILYRINGQYILTAGDGNK